MERRPGDKVVSQCAMKDVMDALRHLTDEYIKARADLPNADCEEIVCVRNARAAFEILRWINDKT